MKRILIFIVISLVSLTGHAEYIDATVKKVDVKRNKYISKMIKACFKTSNSVKCRDKGMKKIMSKYPLRGSLEYSKLHYSKLTKLKADIVIKKLAAIAKQTDVGRRDEDGEISLDDMVNEGKWIQQKIYKRRYSTGPFTLSSGQQLDYN